MSTTVNTTVSTHDMLPVEGEPCPSPLEGAEYIGSVEWYDGPIAGVFRDAAGLLYAHWCDQSATANRWAVVRVTRERLRALGDGAITMHGLLTRPEGEAWLVDLRVSPCTAAEVEEVECVLCVRVTAFPEEYLPDPDSPAPRADWADREALEVVS